MLSCILGAFLILLFLVSAASSEIDTREKSTAPRFLIAAGFAAGWSIRHIWNVRVFLIAIGILAFIEKVSLKKNCLVIAKDD